MKIYVVDSFSDKIFFGNQAGVVILESEEDFPSDKFMKSLAAELKHSETAFVKKTGYNKFQIRYFTPVQEVDLCGHATIGLFSVLRDEKIIKLGQYTASTLAGELSISVEEKNIWMEMAKPKKIKELNEEQSDELYKAFELNLSDKPAKLIPKIMSTGLKDIIMPVKNKESLQNAVLHKEELIDICSRYSVSGVHMFYINKEENITADCRNFAPLVGIDEECATGTSTGALTYYLKEYGMIENDKINIFKQGESMNKPCLIKSKVINKSGKILIGGNAVISLRCKIN